MLRRVVAGLVLLLVIGGFAVAQQSAPSSPCDFVNRFQILNRPTEIALSDVDWIENIGGIGTTIGGRLRDKISQLGHPIRTVDELQVQGLGASHTFSISVFFALQGVGQCTITINSPR